MLTTRDYMKFKILDPITYTLLQTIESPTKIIAARALPEDRIQIVEEEISVVERAEKRNLVGVLELTSKTIYGLNSKKVPLYLCRPINRGYPPFRIPCKEIDRRQNLLIVFQFEDWEVSASTPRGSIVRILGPCSLRIEKEAAVHWISPWNHPKQFSYCPLDPFDSSRKIHLSEGTFNIDPPGCLDIDDVITLLPSSKLKNQYDLWVTIADVASCVSEGSDLDLFALKLGETVYQNGHAMKPMIPRILSENECSLLPGLQRRGISLHAVWDSEVKTLSALEWHEVFVTNQTCYTYESVHNMPILKDICSFLEPDCNDLEQNDSHKWIEALMIWYNREAAKILLNVKGGLLRKQEAERLAATYCSSKQPEIHSTLKSIYCHASSPIRRYADLANQRILKAFISKRENENPQTDFEILSRKLNLRQKDIKEYNRTLFFIEALEKDQKELDALCMSLEDGKIRIYVEAWKQSFKIRLTTLQTIKEGDTLRLKMYYDPEKANWKDKMVFQLVHINSVASTNYQE